MTYKCTSRGEKDIERRPKKRLKTSLTQPCNGLQKTRSLWR